ncbi:tRNA glutamyl-Q(34) synthetase GluQRS [Rhodococcus sp. PAMC28707]|uniref:tRNA glutamyl-Q(34) synthetase GluQRS n=1 Tax=unclassified Rhodococcus (in: high G+C Gram-positive bacteria) TaxID=192944 RepID=UPI00109DAA4D|nr:MULTISPECIES: tRNA glutamyl-Q(34) synthetase GluQRS [unclassified Rhodococcus (in: high G+C Gram-positive bacteria)]QCB49292.1 tRNA glutamyl-Q(34) synthetase GluQRS [Rhodococcus sp. PAMC28705]QCB59020.1 tRNA glutamyl-Q(34) synthetase GluQRS [Rhodococcus sp. PAMC28707]
MSTGAGRFAPSPSGDLHLGNLRTALLAWLFARSTGRNFLMRMEDLDRVRPGAEERQLADLHAIGLDWDGAVVRQSQRTALYENAITRLQESGQTYQCFCTRREILEAASAPHAPDGAYPGTCRNLTSIEKTSVSRSPALRLRSEVTDFSVDDALLGRFHGIVDDFVLRRADGVASYNLAVVVDDGEQGIDQVVRGDDLLTSSPRQAYLASLLQLPTPTYMHVPLALNAQGRRLAKRDGAVTLEDQAALGLGPHDVLAVLAQSIEMAGPNEPVTTAELLTRWDPDSLPRTPWILET